MGLSVETEWTFLIRWLDDEGFLSGGMTFDLKFEWSQQWKKLDDSVNMLEKQWLVHFKWVNCMACESDLDEAFLFLFLFFKSEWRRESQVKIFGKEYSSQREQHCKKGLEEALVGLR